MRVLNSYEPAKLLPIMSEKQNVRTLLQVITYWINENEYRIDFSLWQDNNKENVKMSNVFR